MSNECEKCGLEDPYCCCYEQELEKRIAILEEEFQKLRRLLREIYSFYKE
jgi:hypothetical protein